MRVGLQGRTSPGCLSGCEDGAVSGNTNEHVSQQAELAVAR